MKWIIAYDVCVQRRRTRCARTLERFGFRRQKSVFEGEATRPDMVALLDQLALVIDPRTDRLAAWPIVESPDCPRMHRGIAPELTLRDWSII
jgi:CRISPR-associated endonuclease Cas2